MNGLYIQFDCEGYALSDTFYRIEIELLVFKLCPVLIGQSFSKLSSGCSSEWKMNHLKHCLKHSQNGPSGWRTENN